MFCLTEQVYTYFAFWNFKAYNFASLLNILFSLSWFYLRMLHSSVSLICYCILTFYTFDHPCIRPTLLLFWLSCYPTLLPSFFLLLQLRYLYITPWFCSSSIPLPACFTRHSVLFHLLFTWTSLLFPSLELSGFLTTWYILNVTTLVSKAVVLCPEPFFFVFIWSFLSVNCLHWIWSLYLCKLNK